MVSQRTEAVGFDALVLNTRLKSACFSKQAGRYEAVAYKLYLISNIPPWQPAKLALQPRLYKSSTCLIVVSER